MPSVLSTMPPPQSQSLTRLAEIVALRESPDPSALDMLLDLLGSEDPLIRSEAARAIADAAQQMTKRSRSAIVVWHRTGEQEQLTGLFTEIERCLLQSPPEKREALAEVLGYLRHHRATDMLVAALNDNDGAVRAAAALGLERTRDPLTTPALVASLDDADPWVRRAVASALGALETSEALRGLLLAAGDSEPMVRSTVAHALTHYDHPRSRSTLEVLCADHDPDVRWAAATALGAIGDAGALDELLTMTTDSVRRFGRTIAEVADDSVEHIRRRERGPRAIARRLVHRLRCVYRAWRRSRRERDKGENVDPI